MQTAIMWLEQEFIKLESTIGVHGKMYELIEQAKEMEKQQIYEAFYDGEENSHKYKSSPTLYYNETYGSKGSGMSEKPTTKTEKMYSEEDLREALFFALNIDRTTCCTTRTTDSIVRESIQSLKTYGSKGSDETKSSQTTSEKWNEYQDWLNEVPEISDEEIREQGIKYDNQALSETPIAHFMEGAFWYREQLKKKQ